MFAMGLMVAVGPVAVIGGGISLLARRVRGAPPAR
jgi:hypothetical protein